MKEVTAAKDYPNLFRARQGDGLRWQFQLRDALPPADLISNVSIVPFIGTQCLLMRVFDGQQGVWWFPGGALEPGETYLDALRRELPEEIGARLLTFELMGTWHCHSTMPAPYRPHLPHPESYRVFGYGEVERIGAPTNPPGGERVIEVACVSVEEAVRRLRTDCPAFLELAELYQLAAVLRRKELARH